MVAELLPRIPPGKEIPVSQGAACAACPFRDAPFVPPRGMWHQPDLFIIGESPGRQELAQGRPFVGASGRRLETDLGQVQDLGRVRMTNAVACNPDGQTTPSQLAIKACRPRLLAEIREASPKAILSLGAVPLKALTGDQGASIMKRRGQVFVHAETGISVLPTVHPAAVLRNRLLWPDFAADLEKVQDLHVTPSLTEHVRPRGLVVDDAAWAVPMLRWLHARESTIVVDVETDSDLTKKGPGPRFGEDKILAVALSWGDGSDALVLGEKALEDRATIAALKALLEDPATAVLAWNGKFDLKFLWASYRIRARLAFDGILAHYCHAPGTKVLKRDLTWAKIEDLTPGDELVAFNETGNYAMRPGRVLATNRFVTECFEVITEKGRMVCSADHLWLVSRERGRTRRVWRTTSDLAKGRGEYSLSFFVDPWEVDTSYDGGYMAGILDGEGCLSRSGTLKRTIGGDHYQLTFSQKPGPVLDRAVRILRERGFRAGVGSPRPTSGVCIVDICGSRAMLRAIGMFRPARMMRDTDRLWAGERKNAPIKILAINPIGEHEVVGIETDSATLVADGFFSHNCMDERRGTHDLKQRARIDDGAPDWEGEMHATWVERRKATLKAQLLASLSDKERRKKKHLSPRVPSPRRFGEYDRDLIYDYAALDAGYEMRLCRQYLPRLKAEGVERLNDYLLDLSDLLLVAEEHGVAVDVTKRAALDAQMTAEIADMLARLRSFTWGTFNPNSHIQLRTALFSPGYRNLRPGRKATRTSDGGWSTNKDVLDDLKGDPFVDLLIEYRRTVKLHASYVASLERLRYADGRIRPDFKLFGTVTGRLSELIMTIPKPDPKRPNIRDLFVPGDPETQTFAELDYSQGELRVLAAMSAEPVWVDAFRRGEDLHAIMQEAIGQGTLASHVAAWGGDELKGAQSYEAIRKSVKNTNFGAAYGLESKHLAKMWGWPEHKAWSFLQDYWAAIPTLRARLNEIKQFVWAGGVLETPWGRRRRYGLITDEDRHAIGNEASNFFPQSILNDCMLTSLLRFCRIWDPVTSGVCPVILMHDSVVLEARKGVAMEAARTLKGIMEAVPRERLAGWWRAEVPFTVDVKVGPSWGLVQKVAL